MKNILKTIYHSALTLLCILTIFGFLGAFHWTLDLTSHFRLVYAPLLLIGTIYAVLTKRRLLAAALFIFALINLAEILPYAFAPATNAPRNKDSVSVKFLQFNVWLKDRSVSRVTELILSEDADFVALQECAEPCRNELKNGNVAKLYPHFLENQRDDLLLLSKTPITNTSEIPKKSPPLILAESNLSGHRLFIMVTHLTRPSEKPRLFEIQIKELILIANKTRIPNFSFFLLGDLNMTPFSTHFRRLIRETGLKNSQSGFGLQPTYPALIPQMHLRLAMPIIPIDHILISPDVLVRSRQNAPFAGSDHLPVVVEAELGF